VPLAGQLDGEQRAAGLAGHDEDRAVLAAAVVLLVRHPGPDDLARVGVAVVGRGVLGTDAAHGVGIGLGGGVRATGTREFGVVIGEGRHAHDR